MKIITNEKMIKRNGRLGSVTTIVGILVLAGGLYISFRYPSYPQVSWIALLAGFALTQIGMYFNNRWGRHPRPDELLDKGLKNLNSEYTIYHYRTPAAHLLVGPSGVWVITPYFQTGKIVYEKGRWKHKGGNILQKYLRAFAQEGIGRPDLEVPAEVNSVSKFLKKRLPNIEIPEPKGALVFTSEKVELEVEDAPILTVPMKKLKDAIRKAAKDKPLSPIMMQEINEIFS